MAALLLLYIVVAGQRAVLLFASGDAVGIAMGIALGVLPLIALWLLWRELSFGLRSQRLVRLLEAQGALPVDDMPHRASGRPLRDAADLQFPRYREEAERHPEAWQSWFRLGLAYDACGDRRRARAAVRHAIDLERGRRPRSAASQ
ncbi:MAG TPA: hypothetical protein VFQ96_06475 [Microbacteriaceae bacterium]|nr:hypothetical protein [Microbacteriaceae bacterium]